MVKNLGKISNEVVIPPKSRTGVQVNKSYQKNAKMQKNYFGCQRHLKVARFVFLINKYINKWFISDNSKLLAR